MTRICHFYAAGWKEFERLWDAVMTPLLEGVLSKGDQGRVSAPG